MPYTPSRRYQMLSIRQPSIRVADIRLDMMCSPRCRLRVNVGIFDSKSYMATDMKAEEFKYSHSRFVLGTFGKLNSETLNYIYALQEHLSLFMFQHQLIDL